ncbi:Hypothetical predicted protein, partial [Marmota monax]
EEGLFPCVMGERNSNKEGDSKIMNSMALLPDPVPAVRCGVGSIMPLAIQPTFRCPDMDLDVCRL